MQHWTTAMCLGFVLTGGCATSYDPYYYDTAYYDSYWYTYDAAWAYTWVDPWGYTYYYARTAMDAQTPATGFDLSALAAEIATAAETNLSPAGCANAVVSGQTVSMSFSDCTGPLGLASVNGSMTVSLSENNGQLVLSSTSSDLEIDGDTFIVDSVATVTQANDRREVSVTSHSRAPSRVDSRDAQFTVTWERGSDCVEVNGEASTKRGDSRTASTLQSYRRCTGQCPTAGTITVTGGGDRYTASFDGSDRLVVTLPDGDTKDYQLQCQ